MSTNSRGETAPSDLPLRLDGPGGVAARVHRALREAVVSGRLPPGERLPPSRALAEQLNVRRNVVVGAYERLIADGLAEARIGAGTFVAGHVATVQHVSDRPMALDRGRVGLVGDGVFALGRTGIDTSFQDALRRAVTRRLRIPDPMHFRYGDPRGSSELREQVALQLTVGRGVRCTPDDLIIVSGMQQGLRLCLEAILKPGDAVWIEDPGYPAVRRALEAVGARPIPVPVDEMGLVVEEGLRRAPDARAAYVTPSHQFPTGVRMRMPRRIALLEWANATGAWVIEDDYDSEFRYDGPPLTALAGIDAAGRVVYLGTFSKTVFPGLRIGYMVLPPALSQPVVAARAALDRHPPSLLEGAIADLIADGAFAAHVRRMRSRYRSARDAVVQALAAHGRGMLLVTAPEQGLHLVARLPPGAPPGIAGEIRGLAGVEAWLLSETRVETRDDDGFVLGFAGHDIPSLRAGAARLGEAASSVLRTGLRGQAGDGDSPGMTRADGPADR